MALSAVHPRASFGPPCSHTLSVTQAPGNQLLPQLWHVKERSFVVSASRCLSQRPFKTRIWASRGPVATTASYDLVEFSPDDFSVERLVGTYGVMNLSSITPGQSSSPTMDENRAAGYDISDLNRMAGLEVGQSMIETRLYKGRIATAGPRLGTRVLLKAYPSRFTGGAEADAMAANELATHAVLQEDMEERNGGANIAVLLGGFQTDVGEQWLVLRDDGLITAARYAQLGSEATGEGRAVGEQEFWDRFDPELALERRRRFVVKLLRGVLGGLAYMHRKGRLHQSLGPASVVLNLTEERDVKFLQPRLRDFAFAVDVSDEAILKGQSEGPGSELADGLWRRATSAGASMALDRKAFAIADDIYAAGLLVAYLVFVPLCPPGTIDGPSLQRLLETTFRLDLRAAREYCAADDRWTQAVRFLDAGEGAGWQLLQDMLNPNFRLRPTADAVLMYPFLTGAAAPVLQ